MRSFTLPPGFALTLKNGHLRVYPYWDFNYSGQSVHNPARGEGDYVAQLRELIAESVRLRLESDVPLGAFLSGGIDSTTVVATMAREMGRPVKTFSIGFSESDYDELAYARTAARHFHTDHHEFVVTPDVCKLVEEIVWHHDEPFADVSSIPTYVVSKMAREHVTVVLSGDGGDELFAGNERYATQRLFEYYNRIPAWMGQGFIEPVVSSLADRLRWGVFVMGKKYIRRATLPAGKRLTSYDFFNVMPMEGFLTKEFLLEVGNDYDPGEATERLYNEAPAGTELDRQLYLDLHLTISDNDLFKVTRMTEAAGVTARFPFLDRQLAEFAMTVPASMRMRGRNLRTFFKRAYADLLPAEVRSKSKHGFGLPIGHWLQTDKVLADMRDDLVLGPRALARGYFRKEALEELVRRHRSDSTSFYGATLWNLMILELWHRGFESSAGGSAPRPGSST
jgi:asparagine synthase (glutamine-hydrolysing)